MRQLKSAALLVVLSIPTAVAKLPGDHMQQLLESAKATKQNYWTKRISNKLALMSCYNGYRMRLNDAYIGLQPKSTQTNTLGSSRYGPSTRVNICPQKQIR